MVIQLQVVAATASKEATVKVFHYPDSEALKAHALVFVRAYNLGKHLKAPRWRTPFQAVLDAWTRDPSIFKIDPHHLTPGPYNYRHPARGYQLSASRY